MQNLILNILPFTAPIPEKEFVFTAEKKDGFFPISVWECMFAFKTLFPDKDPNEIQYLYTDFSESSPGTQSIKIDLTRCTKFAKHYYTWLIHQYFSNIADISETNFVRDVEVWFESKEENKYNCTGYKVFTLKVQIDRNTNSPELVVSFDGVSLIHKKSILELDIDTEMCKWVVYKKKLYYYEERPAEVSADLKNTFPLLNNPIKYALGIPVVPEENKFFKEKPKNKYKTYFTNIDEFAKTYLTTPEFKKIIPLTSDNFLPVASIKIKNTTPGSNKLEFANSRTDINPYTGLKSYNPFGFCPHPHVNMFFICHENDKGAAQQLATYFRDGLQNFDPLRKLLNLKPNIKKDEQITFKNLENPTIEVRQQLAEKSLDPKIRYIAIYVTPYSKLDNDPVHLQFYYQIKEELLKYGITSQAVETQHISNPLFNLYLINISIAILAKLDGVPWRLKRSSRDELIVGVGAFKPQHSQVRYIGGAFCFSNNGHFYGFKCSSASDTYVLSGLIEKAIRSYTKEHQEVKRLVIHFYKTMSSRELAPIKQMLKDLKLDIPVIIITINKTASKELVIFDTNNPDLIPISGTFVNIGWNEFLLCNNTRYFESGSKMDSYPFPVKLKIESYPKEITDDIQEVKQLVDQVYQFSRMYWKSVKQQNLPVTIKYPEMVAEIFPHFESNIIPPFGENNLWFL